MGSGREALVATVVVGPPAAGKTTYVRQHAQPGDVVIDFDALAVALASPDSHDHPPAVIKAAAAAWSAALEAVRRERVWVIHSLPSHAAYRRYCNMRAEFVVVDPGEDVVRSRLADRPARAADLVDDWYRSDWSLHT